MIHQAQNLRMQQKFLRLVFSHLSQITKISLSSTPLLKVISYTFLNLISTKNTFPATSSNRNELQGTWFVQSICSVLDSLAESEDVLLFFTKVQNHMCQRTNIDCFKAYVGQTPQLHLFASKQFNICPSHIYSVPLNRRYSNRSNSSVYF
jgi:hypothetical protein